MLAFLTQVLLARSLPKADFGAFMAVISLATLAGPLAIFGVAEFWLQRFGREGQRAFRWVRPSIALVVVTSGVLVAALVCWGLLDRHDPHNGNLRIGRAPIILSLVAMALSGSALQLQGAYGRLAALQLAPQVGRLLVAVLTLAFGLSAIMVVLGVRARGGCHGCHECPRSSRRSGTGERRSAGAFASAPPVDAATPGTPSRRRDVAVPAG